MAKTYYAKCGITFQKSSSAGVTRYEDLGDKCKGCPYIEHGSSCRGGKEVPITFCQAGSKKPNHKNEYLTTCESDATSLSIISLDMDFFKAVHEFALLQPGYAGSAKWPKVFHGLDRADCRKSMPLYFENNKKGKAVKKAIIDKFFQKSRKDKGKNNKKSLGHCDTCGHRSACIIYDGKEVEPSSTSLCGMHMPQELFDGSNPGKNCSECIYLGAAHWFNGLGGKEPERDSFACSYDIQEAKENPYEAEYFVRKTNKACKHFKPIHDWTQRDCADCISCKELPGEMKYKAKCPYLSVIGDKYIQCCLHAMHRGRPEFSSQGALHEHTKNVCYCDFDRCDIYQATYKEEMESQDKRILEYRECAYCCNNSHYTGLKEHDGSTHGFCQLWQEDKELFNTGSVCEWFNKRYRPQESKKGKDNCHPDWPSQNCIDCEYCINEQCSQDVFKNTSIIRISKGVKACPRFKQKKPAQMLTEDEKEDKEVYFDGTKCTETCKNSRDGKCITEGVKGQALKYFVMDADAPDCEVMKTLKFKYLKDIRHCSHAHEDCNAVRLNCAMKNEYCCYACPDPCDSACGFAKELVPFGQLKAEDKGITASTNMKPAYIFAMDIAEIGQETALNNHLQHIRKKSEDIVGNYVEIGFTLVNLKENKLFRAKGYDNLVDCVEAELNMKKSTAYNLIKIAEKFGDPETKRLKPAYSKYNYVQCLEMSNMTQEELSQAKPEMSKREMKEIKKSNRLEKSTENIAPAEPVFSGQIDLFKNDSNVIEVTNYSVVNSKDKEGQEQPAPVHPEKSNAVPGQGNTSLPFNCDNSVDDQDEDPEESALDSYINATPVEMQSTDSNDKVINDLLIENENYRLRIADLERNKNTFRELVGQIDSKYDRLSKKQIRNSLWDFINTGMIMFEEQ